jgi:hypothetical protein
MDIVQKVNNYVVNIIKVMNSRRDIWPEHVLCVEVVTNEKKKSKRKTPKQEETTRKI